MGNIDRVTIPENFNYEKLVVLTESDFLRSGCDLEKVDYLFCMGAETIEHDRDIDNVWVAGFPTGQTLAEFIQDVNECDIDEM